MFATARLSIGSFSVGPVVFDVNSLVVSVAIAVVGYQAVWFAVLSKAFASREGLLPGDIRVDRLMKRFPLEIFLLISFVILALGVSGLLVATARWRSVGWGVLDLSSTVRLVIPSAGLVVISAQTALSSLMLSILSLGKTVDPEYQRRVDRRNPEDL
jgi:hypothetical protein